MTNPRRCDCENDACEKSGGHVAGACGLYASRRLIVCGHAALFCHGCADTMKRTAGDDVTADAPATPPKVDAEPGTVLGVDRRGYPKEMVGAAPCVVDVLVVLVAGGVGDYAAYAGIGSPVFVAAYGEKLSFEEAAAHFPRGLERERYRP
jgi:hypothetical protein